MESYEEEKLETKNNYSLYPPPNWKGGRNQMNVSISKENIYFLNDLKLALNKSRSEILNELINRIRIDIGENSVKSSFYLK